ncbi:MAG TPA: ABC transporter permease [Jatrophihabitans sp.]|jgi:peptide/nickel transport system permease protein
MTASDDTVVTDVPIRPPAPTADVGASRWRLVSAFRARKGTIAWAVLIILLAGLAVLVLAPQLVASGNPTASTGTALVGPSGQHWFGTDQLGRDVLTRTVWGARPVVVASVVGIAIATLSGVALGLIGGVAPPLVSGLIMRILDVILALPALLIALMVVAIVGTGTTSVIVAVGFAYAPAFARVIYSSVRRLRTADYIAAAKVFGGTGVHSIFRHLLPNLANEIAVLVSSAIGWAVLTAGTLSFLGFGVSLPKPDWGVDLSAGGQYLETAWWISTFPGLAITATILLSNYLGDFVASSLDPHSSVKAPRASALLH